MKSFTLSTRQTKELSGSKFTMWCTKKVDQPTNWVHNLVIVEEKNGLLRLYLDPRDLNKAVKR